MFVINGNLILRLRKLEARSGQSWGIVWAKRGKIKVKLGPRSEYT